MGIRTYNAICFSFYQKMRSSASFEMNRFVYKPEKEPQKTKNRKEQMHASLSVYHSVTLEISGENFTATAFEVS